MTTSVRLTHLGGSRVVRITEKPRGDQAGGLEAIIAELRDRGDEQVVHVHSGNSFVIEEIDEPASFADPRDPDPQAA